MSGRYLLTAPARPDRDGPSTRIRAAVDGLAHTVDGDVGRCRRLRASRANACAGPGDPADLHQHMLDVTKTPHLPLSGPRDTRPRTIKVRLQRRRSPAPHLHTFAAARRANPSGGPAAGGRGCRQDQAAWRTGVHAQPASRGESIPAAAAASTSLSMSSRRSALISLPRTTTACTRLVFRMSARGSASKDDQVGDRVTPDGTHVFQPEEPSRRCRRRLQGLHPAEAGLDQIL